MPLALFFRFPDLGACCKHDPNPRRYEGEARAPEKESPKGKQKKKGLDDYIKHDQQTIQDSEPFLFDVKRKRATPSALLPAPLLELFFSCQRHSRLERSPRTRFSRVFSSFLFRSLSLCVLVISLVFLISVLRNGYDDDDFSQR